MHQATQKDTVVNNAILERLTARVASLEEEVTALSSQLSHVGESLQLAKIQVAEHINTTSPIASLPDEILAMIFEAGARQQAQRSENRVYFSMLVSQVMHRFLAIAIATPHLWTAVDIDALKPMVALLDL